MVMEEIGCIFCNKRSNQVVISENGFTSRMCDGYKLTGISPRAKR